MHQRSDPPAASYLICILQILDEGWVRALQIQVIATHRHYTDPPRTTLSVQLADQAELLGLLNRLHNMGLTVLFVKRNLTLPNP